MDEAEEQKPKEKTTDGWNTVSDGWSAGAQPQENAKPAEDDPWGAVDSTPKVEGDAWGSAVAEVKSK
jgi:hypothetical protein